MTDIFGPYQRWYRFGWRSPKILFARIRNKHRPLFRLRMAWQRATRGYGDDDLWSLDGALARLTVVGCRRLRENAHSYPTEFADPPVGDGQGWPAWEKILLKIEEGFQAYLEEGGYFSDNEGKRKKFQEAMSLYQHWFSALWD